MELQDTQVVWRDKRSGEEVEDESIADVGGVKDAGVLGEVVGVEESSDVEDEASSVGLLSATRGIGRFAVWSVAGGVGGEAIADESGAIGQVWANIKGNESCLELQRSKAKPGTWGS